MAVPMRIAGGCEGDEQAPERRHARMEVAMMTRFLRRGSWGGLLAVLLIGAPIAARADVEPGTTINKSNADLVKDLVSPGVMWCIKHGMEMKIVPYKKGEWNKAYVEATEKHAGQTKLAPDGRSLIGHVQGLPFPTIDTNDPQVALKIMFNYEYKG